MLVKRTEKKREISRRRLALHKGKKERKREIEGRKLVEKSARYNAFIQFVGEKTLPAFECKPEPVDSPRKSL